MDCYGQLLGYSLSKSSDIKREWIELPPIKKVTRLDELLGSGSKVRPSGGTFFLDRSENGVPTRILCWEQTNDRIIFDEYDLMDCIHVASIGITCSASNIISKASFGVAGKAYVLAFVSSAAAYRLVFSEPNSLDQKAPRLSWRSRVDVEQGLTCHVFALSLTSAACVVAEGGKVFFMGQLSNNDVNLTVFPRLTSLDSIVTDCIRLIIPKKGLLMSLVSSAIWKDTESIVAATLISQGDQALLIALSSNGRLSFWSSLTWSVIGFVDVKDTLSQPSKDISLSQVKLVAGFVSDRPVVAIHLLSADQSMVVIFSVSVHDSGVEAESYILDGPNLDLVDFALSQHTLWAIWATENDTSRVCYADLDKLSMTHGWIDVLDPLSDLPSAIGNITDPKDLYLRLIFHGSIGKAAIVAALSMYMDYLKIASAVEITTELSWETLRQITCQVIDKELVLHIPTGELFQQDYLLLMKTCWSRLYDYVVEHQRSVYRLLGVAVDSASETIILSQASGVVLPHSLGLLEMLYLAPDGCSIYDSHHLHPVDTPSLDRHHDLLEVFGVLQHLRQGVDAVSLSLLHQSQDLSQLDSLVSNLVKDLAGRSSSGGVGGSAVGLNSVLSDLAWKPCSKIVRVCRHVLDKIAIGLTVDNNVEINMSLNHLTLYTRCMSVALRNVCTLRRDLCAYLAILACLWKDQAGHRDHDQYDCLDAELVPALMQLSHHYHLVVWLTDQKVDMDCVKSSAATYANSCLPKNDNCSAVDLIFGVRPGECEAVFSSHATLSVSASLDIFLPVYLSGGVEEVLFSTCQYPVVIRYLAHRSAVVPGSLGAKQWYLLGCSQLATGQYSAAIRSFTKAGTCKESLLALCRLLDAEPVPENILIKMWSSVIIQLTRVEQWHFVLKAAKVGVQLCSKHTCSLFSVQLFQGYLMSDCPKEALRSVMDITDRDLQASCLNTFISELCHRKKFAELCNAHYGHLPDMFVEMLATKARTLDLSAGRFYHLLYSYLIRMGNFRRAAYFMYELALRLVSTRTVSSASLQTAANALVLVVQCLELVPSDHRWLHRPLQPYASAGDGPTPAVRCTAHRSRYSDPVITLDAIRRQYSMVAARSLLASLDDDSSIVACGELEPSEVVGLLIRAGYLDTAFSLLKLHQSSLDDSVELLARHCVQLSTSDKFNACSDWIHRHLAFSSSQLRWKDPVFPLVWDTLHHYLNMLSDPGDSSLYCIVLRTLLSVGYPVPSWLYHRLAKDDPYKLLQLLLGFDQLEAAVDISCSMIRTSLGLDRQHGGTSVHATGRSICLPHNAFSCLRLKLHGSLGHTELASRLDKALSLLTTTLTGISANMIMYHAHKRHD